MKPTSAQQLLRGLWSEAPAGLELRSVVTDNREAEPGSVFVAIRGERVDGHDFAPDAINRGAEVVVATRAIEGVSRERTVLVPDVLDAMIQMGANYRMLFNPLVLGITGSVGKTTTKEFCSAVFSAFDKTLVTEGNQNNEIGMPKTLFRLDDTVRYAVLEMGMQGEGEIRKLTRAAKPDAAIITKIGTAHIEALGSVENILKAKLEICEGLSPSAPLVMNGDDELLRAARPPHGVRPVYVSLEDAGCDVLARDLKRDGDGQQFTIVDNQFGELQAYIPTLGKHTVYDALLAYTAATRLGLNPSQSAAALANYTPAGMRQRITETAGVTLIEDCYNANPDSMAAALETLAELEIVGGARRIAVLGDMRELGETSDEAHRQLGAWCAERGVDLLITVGECALLASEAASQRGVETAHCADNTAAAERLGREAKAGDVVLVKASRGMRFEEIIAAFKPQ